MSEYGAMPLSQAWWRLIRELRHRRATRLASKLFHSLDSTPADERLALAIVEWMEAPKHEHRALFIERTR